MRTIYFIVVYLLLAGCKDVKEKTAPSVGDGAPGADLSRKEHPGKKIMEDKCYICHDATTSEDNRLAPPMIAVKMHYLKGGATKNEFINDFLDWSRKPTLEKSKMRGAVKRFGVMPYLSYPEEEIKQIADYIYDNEIDQPEWFEEHYKKNHGKGKGMGPEHKMARDNKDTDHSALGLKYALSTKVQLGKNLINAIQEKGTVGAVRFCNLRAIKLTDSMAIVNKAKIKRVSDKPRNPDNRANDKELGYIKRFKQMVGNGTEINPMVEEENGQVHFYYPITTNTMCLQCHGTPKGEVSLETLATLRKLYPADLALGYGVNEVRGVWSITFEK